MMSRHHQILETFQSLLGGAQALSQTSSADLSSVQPPGITEAHTVDIETVDIVKR